MTNVNLSQDPHPLAITDPDLFKYPYIYAVEVGQMELNTQEAARLREYLLRGGFWHVDDFWGLRQWGQFERQMKKVFPDRQIEELPMTHEIFHTFFDVDRVLYCLHGETTKETVFETIRRSRDGVCGFLPSQH